MHPPNPHLPRTGRPFNTTTPLGRLMLDRGYGVNTVEQATGINHRTISDYLAGRKAISGRHIATLCEEFQVSKQVLLGDAPPPVDRNRVIATNVDPAALIAAWQAGKRSGQQAKRADCRGR